MNNKKEFFGKLSKLLGEYGVSITSSSTGEIQVEKLEGGYVDFWLDEWVFEMGEDSCLELSN